MRNGILRSSVIALSLLALSAPAFAAGGGGHGGDKSKSKQDAEAVQKRGTTSQVYVAAAPVSATLTENYQLKGLLQVDAGFDIPDDKLRAKAEAMAPRLRDAMREAISQYALVYQRPGGVPDADKIKQMLQAAADKTLGKAGAKLVLVSVMVHDGGR